MLGLPWQRIGEAGVITRVVERAQCNCRMCRCACGAVAARSRSVIAADAPRHAGCAEQLREAVRALMTTSQQDREIAFKQATIDKLTHEMAVLKRLKFAAKSEAFNAEQKSLLEETIDADLAALAAEIEQRSSRASRTPSDKQQPKRQTLPAHLPRREIRHEPENTTCGCG